MGIIEIIELEDLRVFEYPKTIQFVRGLKYEVYALSDRVFGIHALIDESKPQFISNVHVVNMMFTDIEAAQKCLDNYHLALEGKLLQ